MQINSIYLKPDFDISSGGGGKQKSNLAPLPFDTVSFGAMKKREFTGVDLFVVNQFKAPIEKFNTNSDFQNWCQNESEKIENRDYTGRKQETGIKRRKILKRWKDYLYATYSSAAALLAFNSISKTSKQNNDALPPELHTGALSDTIEEIEQKTDKNSLFQCDFNKMYAKKLEKHLLNTDTSNMTGWVEIPSQMHDPDNFKDNILKLQTLSCKTWCTKQSLAARHLKTEDFHIYLENGKPKVSISVKNGEICEIQGVLNNWEVPLQYLSEIEKHIEKTSFDIDKKMQEKLNNAHLAVIKLEKAKDDLKGAISNNDTKTIYEYFGINTEENNDGTLSISEYRQPDISFTYNDLGIDENVLLEKTSIINGNANFYGSNATDLGAVKWIERSADFRNSKFTSLNNLKSIGKDADLRYSNIKDLGALEEVGANIYFCNSPVVDLKNLCSIGLDADFRNSNIKSLGNLQFIGLNAYISDEKLKKPLEKICDCEVLLIKNV